MSYEPSGAESMIGGVMWLLVIAILAILASFLLALHLLARSRDDREPPDTAERSRPLGNVDVRPKSEGPDNVRPLSKR